MEGTYKETLAWCAAALVFKNMVNHVLVVRCRMASSDFNQSVSPESDPSQWYGKFLFPFMYHGMGGSVGPLRSKADMARFQAMEVNATQNETFFMILAIVWPNIGPPPDWAPTALLIFTYSRFAHFLLFTVIRMQPWRAMAWVVGVGVNIAMAINILQGSK
jgi:uncharacterized MAPEG superfamily protein